VRAGRVKEAARREQLGEQVAALQAGARTALLDMFPHLRLTVQLLFHPRPQPVLLHLHSGGVAALLRGLSELLHSPVLPAAAWGDLALCAAVSLLYSCSLLLRGLPGLADLPSALLSLQEQCALHYYSLPGPCWAEARALHLLLWRRLLLACCDP
jgi:hypothetical protein